MRNLLAFLLIAISFGLANPSSAQVSYALPTTNTTDDSMIDKSLVAESTESFGGIASWAYYTPAKDSLWFDSSDSMGVITYQMWHKDPRGWNQEFNPVIMLVSHNQMIKLRARLRKEVMLGMRN